MIPGFRVAAALALSAAGAFALLVPANAQNGSQMGISRCSTRPYGNGQVELSISFTNRSVKVAQAVDFAVQRNGGLGEVRDLGNFTQGALIAHNWVFPQGRLPGTGQPTCQVLGIIYRNASAWANPNPPY